MARTALELMHFRNIDKAVTAADPTLLEDAPEAKCVKGCYRCLLSYYNQPDHEMIDRQDADVKAILVRLARSTVTPAERHVPPAAGDPWLEAFAQWGIVAPDVEPLRVAGASLPFVWRSSLVVAHAGTVLAEVMSAAEVLGFALAELPDRPDDTPPPALIALLGVVAG